MLLGAGGGGAVLELLILYRSERLLFDGGREGDLYGASVVPWGPPSFANCLSGLLLLDVSYLLQFPWPEPSVVTEGMVDCGVLRRVRLTGKGGGSVTRPLLEAACVCVPSKLAGVVCIRARIGF